jgi:hypothetical protein
MKRRIYKNGRARSIGSMTHEEVCDKYRSGLSCREISEIDGTTRVTILMLLRRNGVELRSPGGGAHGKHKTKHGLMVQWQKSGVTPATLARFKVILLLGGRCVRCGNNDLRVLEINHIGKKKWSLKVRDLAEIASGKADGFDVRCANCNVLYEYECGRRRLPLLK